MGTAFDYLLRFNLEFRNRGKIVARHSWITDRAYGMLEAQFHMGLSSGNVSKLPAEKMLEREKRFRFVTEEFNRAKTNHGKFIAVGRITDSLIESAIFPAKPDALSRRMVLDQIYVKSVPSEVSDLRVLISLVDFDRFSAGHKCYINPDFGKGSSLVMGADADLIIDTTLIEIKVVQDLEFKREFFNQLIAYYICLLSAE
jgi:hypothetical protein